MAGLATHALLPQLDSLPNSLRVAKELRWWALAAAILAQGLSYLGSGVLLRGIAWLGGRPISVGRGMLITAASYSAGVLAGGILGSSAASYRWMRQGGASPEAAALSGWLPGLLDDLLLFALALVGVVFLLIRHSLTRLEALGFALVACILILLVAGMRWAARHPERATALTLRAVERWAFLRGRRFRSRAAEADVQRFLRALNLLFDQGWKQPIAGGALSIGFDMATLLFVFAAAGTPVNLGVLLVGYGLPLLIGKAPLLPGGVGLVEGTMAALYGGLGIPPATTVVVVLVYRLLSFWAPMLIGLPFIPYLERGAQKSVQDAQA